VDRALSLEGSSSGWGLFACPPCWSGGWWPRSLYLLSHRSPPSLHMVSTMVGGDQGGRSLSAPVARGPPGLLLQAQRRARWPHARRYDRWGGVCQSGRVDATTLILLGALGGSASTLATILVFGLIGRFIYRSWMDVDALRSGALSELRAENAHLRQLLEEERNHGRGSDNQTRGAPRG
jgi:hypothetical protein